MIEAIRLVNFMAFRDTGWVDLKPITLIFGKNSSGKSALIRALLLLKQSVDTTDTARPLNFFSTTGIDLEGFRTIVHAQDDKTPLGFGFRFRFRELEEKARNGILVYVNNERANNNEDVFSPTDPNLFIEAGFSYKLNTSSEDELIPTSLQLNLVYFSETRRETVILLDIDKTKEESVTFSDILSALVINNIQLGSPKYGFWPQCVLEGDDQKSGLMLLEDIQLFYEAIQRQIMDFLVKISYIGPLREPPQRVYAISRSSRITAKEKGASGFYRFLERELDTSQSDQIDLWAQNLELAQKVAVVPEERQQWVGYSSLSQIIISEFGGLSVNLSDVGSGTAQVLPVVIESISAKEDALVIIEQPELHLHPDAQSTIADLFIELINQPQEGGSITGKRFLLETHSEHILIRLRKRLAQTAKNVLPENEAQKQLSINQLVVYLVTRNQGTLVSDISPVILNKVGEYRQLPKGFRDFFASDTVDVLEMTSAKLGIKQDE